MRGRATQDRCNALIDVFNEFVRNKYHILSQPIRRLSKAAMQQYKSFKDAEVKETRGLYFFTDEDTKSMEGFRPDATGIAAVSPGRPDIVLDAC